MALTFTRVASTPSKSGLGGFRSSLWDITFDNAYATGGWAITPASLGLSTIYSMASHGGAGTTGATYSWDSAANKLLAFKSNTASLFQEIAAADLNTRVGRFLVIGA